MVPLPVRRGSDDEPGPGRARPARLPQRALARGARGLGGHARPASTIAHDASKVSARTATAPSSCSTRGRAAPARARPDDRGPARHGATSSRSTSWRSCRDAARAILAVDGGGSKIDAVLLRRDGSVLGAAAARATPTVDGHEQRRPHERHGVGVGVTAEPPRAGLVPPAPVAELGVFCLAGADLPADDRRIAAMAASTRAGPRRTCCATTRSRCCAPEPTGRGGSASSAATAQLLAACARRPHHAVPRDRTDLGDWGGGDEIGSLALGTRSAPRTAGASERCWSAPCPRTSACGDRARSWRRIYFGRIDGTAGRAGARLVRAAVDGDAIARDVVDRQADEVVAMAGPRSGGSGCTTRRRCRAGRRDLPQRRPCFLRSDPRRAPRGGAGGARARAGRAARGRGRADRTRSDRRAPRPRTRAAACLDPRTSGEHRLGARRKER